MFILEITAIILICQKLGSIGPIQQKIKSPLPNTEIGGGVGDSLDREGE